MLNRLSPILLACFALLQSIAPQGFMPVFGQSGFVISICSASSSKTMTISPNDANFEALALVHGVNINDNQKHDDPATDEMPCTYSGADAASHAPGGFSLTDPQPTNSIEPATLNDLIKSRHSARTPPATGPPIQII